MEILERYLQAVKKYLPWQRQDDGMQFLWDVFQILLANYCKRVAV